MKNLTNFFNLIKGDKKTRMLLIMTIALLFIFTIGYSLSMFTGSSNKKVANIKVNDLSFNITTNSGESNDRILHLQAGKTESFKIKITNLNKIDTKYELIYKVCKDVKCTSYLDTLPNEIKIGLNPALESNITGILVSNNSSEVNLLTANNTDKDYYILLDLQAGYSWNDLALLNQFNDFSKYVSIIAYVDGVEIPNYPDSCNYTAEIIGYKNNNQVTLKEATATCNNNEWKISYIGMPDKLQIKFKKAYNLVQYITNLDKTSNGLEVDTTPDQNLRYVGATPNNYISFNNEIWRIIGVFNIYNNYKEMTEKLVKIIRDKSLGDYSWDSSVSTINNGYGINEWSQADLMNELNIDYLDTYRISGTTTWYNGQNNLKNGSYDYSKNIKNGYIDKIANVRWNLGGISPFISAIEVYSQERGTVHVIPNDGIARTNTWDGKIALMYASDYGYASADIECRNNIGNSNKYCQNNNWLYNNFVQWTLSSGNNYGNLTFYIYPCGGCSNNSACYKSNVRPTLFLISEIQVVDGIGTDKVPYVIDNNF